MNMKTYENFINNNPKINYWENGQKKSEKWLLNGKKHREDGPSYQEWWENGQKWIEKWSLNGKNHREGGPSYQSWYENGQKESEEWYLNGKLHREDGPALQFEKCQYWFLNNIRYSREEWIEQLRKIDSPHYREQKILLDAEKYNL